MRSPHVAGHVCLRHVLAVFVLTAVALVSDGRLTAQQVVPGTNVNMVSGTRFPGGDPYLQRQNEPSGAVSTRNPLHLLAGANDYRTRGPARALRSDARREDERGRLGRAVQVDRRRHRPGRARCCPAIRRTPRRTEWLRPIKATAGGHRSVRARRHQRAVLLRRVWRSIAASNKPSTIFVARYMDLNNREAGDPIAYLDTRLVDSDAGAASSTRPRSPPTSRAPDRPADDQPRRRRRASSTQTIPAGNVYVAYSAFTGIGRDRAVASSCSRGRPTAARPGARRSP